MGRSSLRYGLIGAGFLTIPALIIFSIMLYSGLLFINVQDTSSVTSLFTIQLLIGISGAPAVSAISFWAAHNLAPLKFMSTKTLSKYLSLSIWVNLLGFLISIVNVPIETAFYGQMLETIIPAIGYMLSTFTYAASSILLLIFARKQILAKMAGETLKEPSLAETFS